MKRKYYSGFSFFFNPHELTKIVLKSSRKYYCTKLHSLVQRTEPKRFFLFSCVTYHTGRDQRVPPFNFFWHCETFFSERNFPQRIPLHFFCCFATEWMLENPKGSPFHFFSALWDLFPENKNFSRLQFFDVLRQNGCWKTPKGSPLSFSALWDFFFENLFSLRRVPLQLRQKLWQFWKCPPFNASGACASGPRRATWFIFFAFVVFQYCKLTLGSLFAIFEPWIRRRLGPVPTCCFSLEVVSRRSFSENVRILLLIRQQKLPTPTTTIVTKVLHQLSTILQCCRNFLKRTSQNQTKPTLQFCCLYHACSTSRWRLTTTLQQGPNDMKTHPRKLSAWGGLYKTFTDKNSRGKLHKRQTNLHTERNLKPQPTTYP